MWLYICTLDFKTQLVTPHILCALWSGAKLERLHLKSAAISRFIVLCALQKCCNSVHFKVLQFPGYLCSVHLKGATISRCLCFFSYKEAAICGILVLCALTSAAISRSGHSKKRGLRKGVSQAGARPQTLYIATTQKHSTRYFYAIVLQLWQIKNLSNFYVCNTFFSMVILRELFSVIHDAELSQWYW